MEWKNDVLRFSGFDYGVSKIRMLNEELHSECDQLSKSNESTSLKDITEEPKDEKLESIIETAKNKESEKEENSHVFNDCEFDAMTERKIENFYFRNVEQAEKKMKHLTTLKSKWSEPWQTGEEIVAKVYLKPKNHENPWKDGTFQEKEAVEMQKNGKKHGRCIIS